MPFSDRPAECLRHGTRRPRKVCHNRHDKTGETYLKLPVLPPEVLDQVMPAFGTLLQSLWR